MQRGITRDVLHSRSGRSSNPSPIRANSYLSIRGLARSSQRNEAIRSLLFPTSSWPRELEPRSRFLSPSSRNRCNFTPPSSSCSRGESSFRRIFPATDFSRGIRGNFTNPTAVLYVIKSVPVLESLEFFADTSAEKRRSASPR